jgi:peptidoglycan/xylan/chitin deacetylase (PgdA/CDA1 family)
MTGAARRWAGTPGATARTPRRLVADHGGFEYDSDYYGDDLPFWLQVRRSDGSAGAAPDRALHAGLQRHALRAAAGLHRTATQFFQYLTRQPSTRSTPRATEQRRKMMSIGMHCRLLGRPGRIARAAALPRPRRRRTTACGCARRMDIARHWQAAHPFDPDTAFVWE